MLKFLFMTEIFVSITGAGVTLAVILAERLLKNKFSHSFRYSLYLIALAAMLLPVCAFGSANVSEELQPAAVEVTDSGSTETAVTSADAPAPVAPESVETAVQAADYDTIMLEELFQKEENSPFPIRPEKKGLYILIAAGLWLAIAALLLIADLLINLWFKVKIFALSRPARAEKVRILEEVSAEMNMRRRIRLREFSGGMSPFITGIIFNTIYIPQDALADDLRLILRHEIMHCKRGDVLIKRLSELTAIVHFYNPFAHILKRRINKLCELSCDERAVDALDFGGKKEYTLAVLRMVRQNRFRIHGAAALGERKSNLAERVETIMRNKHYTKSNKIAARALLLAALMLSTVFAALVQAQNDADMPQAVYTTDRINLNALPCEQLRYGNSTFYSDIDTKGISASYSSVLGVTKLKISWNMQDISEFSKEFEEQKQLLMLYESSEEYVEDTENEEYTAPELNDLYELELTSVDAVFSSNYKSLVGKARISRNGEAVLEDVPVTVDALPGSSQYKYETMRTELTTDDITLDGVTFYLDIILRFENVTNDDRIEYQSVRYNFDKSLNTQTVLLENLVECRLPEDGWIVEDAKSMEIKYNPVSQRAEISLSVPYENNSFSMYLGAYDQAKVTEDSIRATFIYYPKIYSEMSAYERCKWLHDGVTLTVTGLSGDTGDYVEIASDDGSIYLKYEIGYIDPKGETYLKGTRDPSEFIVEGEDYFVGTPTEQENFDRYEHDRYYKRIVVDNDGKVIFVIPIELQMTAAVDAAADKLNDDDYDDGYFQAFSYENMVRLCYDENGNVIAQTGVLLDPVTWWVRAVLTPENCFADVEAYNTERGLSEGYSYWVATHY